MYTAAYIAYLNRLELIHSGKSRFVQDGSYEKKAKDDVKADWRRRKGFSKDCSKHRTWCKCGRLLKTWDSRLRRRHDKRLIKRGDWDQIYYHPEMFISSWDFC